MIVRVFKLEDYARAKLVNGIGFEHWGLKYGIIPALRAMEQSGTFWTLLDGDEIVLIAGWHEAWSGVCEVSLFPTQRFINCPVAAVLRLRKEIKVLRSKYRRIQLNCRKEERFTNFARRLGFHVEGVLQKFGNDGRDHVLMAIVEGV